MKREYFMAFKELRDYLISKRFILIFTILLLLSAYSIIQGIDNYKNTLDMYKSMRVSYVQSEQYQSNIKYIDDLINKAQNGEVTGQDVEALKYMRAQMVNPSMPSSLMIFKYFNDLFLFVGMALSLILGFDIISKEHEQGTLKTLLLHPVYRDSIINGKMIGAMAMLVIAVISVLLITIAVLLFYKIVPTLDNLFWIGVDFIISLLYCATFFTIAMAISTLTKNSTQSILGVLGVAIIFFATQGMSTPITNFIMGSSPVLSQDDMQLLNNQSYIAGDNAGYSESQAQYYSYWEKYVQIQRYICTVSPIFNYQVMTNGITSVGGPDVYRPTGELPTKAPTKADVLLSFGLNTISLVTVLILSLGISYISFLRTDIR